MVYFLYNKSELLKALANLINHLMLVKLWNSLYSFAENFQAIQSNEIISIHYIYWISIFTLVEAL